MKSFYSSLKYVLAVLLVFVGAQLWANDVTDVLNQSVTGVTGTGYSSVTDISVSSSAVYSIQCAGDKGSIQLRSKNNNSGIVTTASGGKATKIVVEWNDATADARKLDIYGSNTAYTAPSDLYSEDTQGTLIGSLTKSEATDGVSTLEISGDYTFIGIRSNNAAIYLNSVSVTWSSDQNVVAKPTFTPQGTSFAGSISVSLAAAAGDIYYTTDGTDPTTESAKYESPLTLTATTTVKAIAVTADGQSAVAEATYTALTKSTIAEAQALTSGASAYIEGVCVASAANGAVLYDGTDYVYYYNTANTLEVGKSYSLFGTLGSYGGAIQFTSAASVSEIEALGITVPATAVTLTGADADAAAAAKAAPRQLVSLMGTLTISGNYYNIALDGAETAIAALVKPAEDLSELNGKRVIVTGYEMYVSGGKYVYLVATSVKEVPTALTNADFEADGETNAIGIRTYQKDIAGEDVAQLQPVSGWTIAENGDARAAGTFAYGSQSFMGGPGYVAPAFNLFDGETKALGLLGVWTAKAQYTQDVYLEPGNYMLQVPVYNSVGGTTAIDQNLIGVAGTFAATKQYPVGQWTVENLEFTIDTAKLVTVSLGYKAANSGNAAMPHLFIESAKIYSGDEAIAAAKTAADEAVAAFALKQAKAQATATLNGYTTGDGLFYYSESSVKDALAAVEAATTPAEVEAALAKAVQNEPVAGQAYYVGNKTAAGNLSIATNKVTVEPDSVVYFTKVNGGYVISNAAGEFIAPGANKWTFATTTDTAKAYVVTIAMSDGAYTLHESNGYFGTDNTEAGSAVYANKAVANNGLWTITAKTDTKYAITIAETENGTVTADKTEATEGETVTLTVTPAEGYYADQITAMADTIAVPVNSNAFAMPAADVTVTATFKPLVLASGDYLIKNVATGKYLGGANSWGTQASLVDHGRIFTLAAQANGKYTFDSHTYNNATQHFLGTNAYVDANAANLVVAETEGGYTIGVNDSTLFGAPAEGTAIVNNLKPGDANAVWQIVSIADAVKALEEGTDSDATFLMKDASISRNLYNKNFENVWQGTDFSKGGDNANQNAEKWGGNSQTFDVYQKVAVPNGKYKVTMQGYYRYNNTEDNSNAVAISSHADGTEQINSFLYANDDSVALKSIADDAAVDSLGGTDNLPMSLNAASAAFAKGLYQNELTVTVTNDTLTIGVKKGTHPGCDWTVWDNFVITKIAEEPVVEDTVLVINAQADREIGQGYTNQDLTLTEEQATQALNFLGITSVTDATVVGINVTNDSIVENAMATYDGWHSKTGDFINWGDNAFLCVKYVPTADVPFTFNICDMNNPAAGDSVTVKWGLKANGKTVVFNITVNFIGPSYLYAENLENVGSENVDIIAPDPATPYSVFEGTVDLTKGLNALGEESGYIYAAALKDNTGTALTSIYTCNPHPGFWMLDGMSHAWGGATFGVSFMGFDQAENNAVSGTTATLNGWAQQAVTENTTVQLYLLNADQTKYYVYNITFRSDITTGINGVNADKQLSGDIYTIDGKIVRKNATTTRGLAKGLYIIGGKKVMVK